MWEDWKTGDGFYVGDKFNIPSIWGDPDLPNSIVTEITEITSNGMFYWRVIKPEVNNHYKVGHVDTALSSHEEWKILRLQRDYVYDQTGDTDDDI